MGVERDFEPVAGTRHRVELVDGAEWVVARARRNWFVLLFVAVWLTGWTFGGISAVTDLVSHRQGGPFLVVWLIGWAFGWLFAASTIGWQLAGRTEASVHGGALVYRLTMPLFTRTRRYDARQVRRLRPATQPALPVAFGGGMRDTHPPLFGGAPGSVQFDYGARTVRLLPGLDEAEGRMVAEWLGRRLPREAVG